MIKLLKYPQERKLNWQNNKYRTAIFNESCLSTVLWRKWNDFYRFDIFIIMRAVGNAEIEIAYRGLYTFFC